MTCSFTVASFQVPAHFFVACSTEKCNSDRKLGGAWEQGYTCRMCCYASLLSPQVGHAPSRRPPLAEVVDQDMDGDLQLLLKPYSPQFECQPGVSGTTLCLATTTLCCSPPVAAHGLGEGESMARRDAAVRLMENLVTLGYKVA